MRKPYQERDMTYQKSPEQIQDEISQTRARMQARLDMIGETASPASIAAKMLDLDSSNASSLLETAIDRVKSNPVAAMSIAAGFLGLSKSVARKNEKPNTMSATNTSGDPAQRVRQRADRLKRDAASATRAAGRKLADVQDSANSLRSEIGGSVKSNLDEIQESAEEALEEFSQRADDLRASTKYQTENAVAWVKDNPVPAGLLALAAGATLASVITAKTSSTSTTIRRGRACPITSPGSNGCWPKASNTAPPWSVSKVATRRRTVA